MRKELSTDNKASYHTVLRRTQIQLRDLFKQLEILSKIWSNIDSKKKPRKVFYFHLENEF